MRSISIVAAVAVVTISISGCATNEQNRRGGTGALVGAGVGAVAGQAIGRSTRATVGGAAAGALLGAVVGTASTPSQDRDHCRYRRSDGTIYIAPC